MQDHPEKAFAVGFDFEAPGRRHPRDIFIDHGQQHHLLVQHLVVQQVMQQRVGHGVRAGREEHGGALDAVRWLHTDAGDEDRQGQPALVHTLHEQLLAALPGGHQHEQGDTGHHREGAALDDFWHVGGEVQAVHQQETEQQRDRQQRWPLPQQEDHGGYQDSGHQHGPGHRYAISRGQGAGRLKAEHQQDDADHQRPVHRADVDLALFGA
ncbi:hypothetical protein D3C73_1073140 [compost metagenome]